jgi:molybdopterin converting factor small subunit
MKVTVRYLAQVKLAAGVAAEHVELEAPCTAPELLQRLAERRGPVLRALLLTEDGRPQPTILLFVGAEQVSAAEAGTLADGDVVTVLSPMAGG